MTVRSTRMTHSSRTSPWRRAWGDRLCLLTLACLLAALPCAAGAEDFFARAQDAADGAQARAYVQDVSGRLWAQKPAPAKDVWIGRWCVRTDGFAFLLPEGLLCEGRYRSTALLLVDEATDTAYRTMITLAITGEDEGLDNLTPARAKVAWGSQFSRFELLAFSREAMYGETGIRLSFLTGDSPRLLIQQQLFNKGGRSYIVTLTVENSFPRLCVALEQLSTFCDSLLFRDDQPGNAH